MESNFGIEFCVETSQIWTDQKKGVGMAYTT
jgi:hypothetical protein